MNESLAKTFELLARSENVGANEVLIGALDSDHADVRIGAVRAIAQRKDQAAHREVIRRLHQFGDEWSPALEECRGRMTHALRDALVDVDPSLSANACRAVVRYHEYDLMPVLVTVLENSRHKNAELAAQSLLDVAEQLYQELNSPRDYRNRRDPQLVRRNVTVSLEQSVARYSRHQRKEVLEAFLLLAARDNCTLQQVLLDPLHASYTGLMDALLHSERPGVMRLLLSFLEDHQPPSAAMTTLARRNDERFVRSLLKKIGHEPSAAAARNLKRVDSIPWTKPRQGLLESLDDDAQHSAIRLLVASGVKRAEAFRVLEYLALNGAPGGRRAAYQSLPDFTGPEASALTAKGLDDFDPWIQAMSARQLRQRGLPSALPRLIELIDSPHEIVRQAVRESLSEFTFQRYLTSYDMLEPAVRASTGPLVRKIDPLATQELLTEMESTARTRRLRAIEIAESMQVLPDVEPKLIELLRDADNLVRTEAARALGLSNSPEALDALHLALTDRSVMVQHSAKASLTEIEQRAEGWPNLVQPASSAEALFAGKFTP